MSNCQLKNPNPFCSQNVPIICNIINSYLPNIYWFPILGPILKVIYRIYAYFYLKITIIFQSEHELAKYFTILNYYIHRDGIYIYIYKSLRKNMCNLRKCRSVVKWLLFSVTETVKTKLMNYIRLRVLVVVLIYEMLARSVNVQDYKWSSNFFFSFYYFYYYVEIAPYYVFFFRFYYAYEKQRTDASEIYVNL